MEYIAEHIISYVKENKKEIIKLILSVGRNINNSESISKCILTNFDKKDFMYENIDFLYSLKKLKIDFNYGTSFKLINEDLLSINEKGLYRFTFCIQIQKIKNNNISLDEIINGYEIILVVNNLTKRKDRVYQLNIGSNYINETFIISENEEFKFAISFINTLSRHCIPKLIIPVNNEFLMYHHLEYSFIEIEKIA